MDELVWCIPSLCGAVRDINEGRDNEHSLHVDHGLYNTNN